MSTLYGYQAYGLYITADSELPELTPCQDTRPADIHVSFSGGLFDYDSVDHVFELSYATAPSVRSSTWEEIDRDDTEGSVCYRIRYWGDLEFIISSKGARIWINQPEAVDCEKVVAYLMGPVLGYAMRLQGILCLHASVIEIDGHAIALIAPSGGGKSTTAAALATRGYPSISDDLLALEIAGTSVSARPGLPWLRLLDDSVPALIAGLEQSPDMVMRGEKWLIELPQTDFPRATAALPLIAIYTATSFDASASVSLLSGSDSVMALLANTYPGSYYRLPKSVRVEDLGRIKQVLRHVQVRGLCYSRSLDTLRVLCDTIIADAKQQIDRRSSTNREVQSLTD